MKEHNPNTTTIVQEDGGEPATNPETYTMDTADLKRLSKSNIRLSLFAVIIALGATGVGTWIWTKTYFDIADIEDRILVMDERIEDLDTKPALINLSERLESENSILAKKISEQKEFLESLQRSLAHLYTSNAQTPRDWTIAKALYLAELANYRIKFARDIDAAVMALKGADDILEESVDLSLSSAREAISADIEKLNLIELPNLYVIDEKLHRMLEEHKYIPLVKPDTNRGEKIQLKETSHSSTDVDKSENMFHALLKEINKHLVVKRHEAPIEPLPSQQTQIYYYQILRLKLESIRFALLKTDNNEYEKQLNATLNWLDSHYTPTSAKPLKEELQQLIAINIAPSLPEVTESIEALKTLLDAEQKRRISE